MMSGRIPAASNRTPHIVAVELPAGEGMQRNFIKAGLGMNRKMKVFITHRHADHCFGLLGLLQTMALQGRERPLDIYGQPRLKEFLLGSTTETLLAAFQHPILLYR